MKKTIGYIPLDKGEKPDHKQHVIINGEWLKLAEVWIPGVREPDEERDENGRLLSVNTKCGKIDLSNPRHYTVKVGQGNRCANCNKKPSEHIGEDLLCPEI